MATIFYDSDARISSLAEIPIGIIGYGNQGRAHALNLRDSGLQVLVGTRSGSNARLRSTADGFATHDIGEVVENCPTLAILLPDEQMADVYVSAVEPYLKAHSTFIFAHGFCVRHKLLHLPDDADIILVAPTGPGHQVRSLFEVGKGVPALVAVDQDASGIAWETALAYAAAIGCTRAGAIKTTFEEETVTDLYCEQVVLTGGMPELIKNAFDTLVARGYQKELAYISCLKEVKLIADLLFTKGIDGMRASISNTAKYGSAIAGPALINKETVSTMTELLTNIETHEFAKKFIADSKNNASTVSKFCCSENESLLAATGRELKEKIEF